jgi:hypothetical protein
MSKARKPYKDEVKVNRSIRVRNPLYEALVSKYGGLQKAFDALTAKFEKKPK